VMVENKDVGRLRPGMLAQVKVDTFPFARFGVVPASIILISADAIQDEKKGPVYKARLKLSRTEMVSGSDAYQLSAGMTTTAEIKIGYRRVIHYFLDPFIRSLGESIREW
jgi:hemolysin D